MNCRAVRALAGAYALDALAEPERMEVDHHLDRCAACRAYVGKLSDAAASLAELVPPQAPPAGLKERIVAAALRTAAEPSEGTAAGVPGAVARPTAAEVSGPAGRPAKATEDSGAYGSQRWRRAMSVAVRVAAAVALVALGWAAGRMAPTQPAGLPRGAADEIARMRLERDLWKTLSPPGAAVMPLTTDASVSGTVAYASVLGDERGCWVRLVAEGLPEPPAGMRYAVWVATRQGEPRPIGQLDPVGSGRWELSARIGVPPAQLGALRVVLQDKEAAGPDAGRPIAWGQPWPEDYGW